MPTIDIHGVPVTMSKKDFQRKEDNDITQHCVYAIINNKTKNRYIGLTIDFSGRIYDHMMWLDEGTHKQRVQEDFDQTIKKDLTVKVLHMWTRPQNKAVARAKLKKMEQMYIDSHIKHYGKETLNNRLLGKGRKNNPKTRTSNDVF